ncbi:para-aminobenzoate synthase component I [Alcanivorax hongdengensis A-11-3]|uniref:Para-aminobenzoate synthase component I n=1 Tax=Alcanivorax hongdengensis A-11-3 TaxID=1177179 RepID=L0W7X0_9GAMM|nr:aminodeoxychorismate synthase component I [Alcanivorax hongdengensis]EKF72813.1 para-aminobenzoate synthase component I [Alcanivorax hongdengensis A-11-3]
MLTSCLFTDNQQILALGQPCETLEARSEAQLRALPGQLKQAFRRGIRFAAGVVPYEAGYRLHGMEIDRHSTAIVHLYRERPSPIPSSSIDCETGFRLTTAFTADMAHQQYRQRIDKILAYLEAGDCYQVNLAQRFSATFEGDPLAGWQKLLWQHPAPHACFFRMGEDALFGVSPERFLSIQQDRVVTEPIKGSRPRGATPEEDARLGEALRQHPKDRAENLMIVDLLRNDLGACCEPGSVRAEPLFELRRFSNVQHLVSTVSGRLRAELTPLDALLSAFPGGSITGAPKRRAMEIIAELEPSPRGAYCGSFFWQDDLGNFDSNILIRTMQTRGKHLYCHGGGGIVYDSDPAEEYRESLFKVEKLMAALQSG